MNDLQGLLHFLVGKSTNAIRDDLLLVIGDEACLLRLGGLGRFLFLLSGSLFRILLGWLCLAAGLLVGGGSLLLLLGNHFHLA